MNGLGQEFLAGSRFTPQEHGGPAVSHLHDLSHDLAHGLGRSHDPVFGQIFRLIGFAGQVEHMRVAQDHAFLKVGSLPCDDPCKGLEKILVRVQMLPVLHGQIRTKNPDDFALLPRSDHRHADEGQRRHLVLAPAACSIEKHGFVGHDLQHDGFPGAQDMACDSLSRRIGRGGGLGMSMGDAEPERVRLGVENGQSDPFVS